ncbi:MAG: hypothetical protein PHE36_15080 [Novosphingobium sp.]|nr:hypothetical protein [Novosphingobium sp.]
MTRRPHRLRAGAAKRQKQTSLSFDCFMKHSSIQVKLGSSGVFQGDEIKRFFVMTPEGIHEEGVKRRAHKRQERKGKANRDEDRFGF